MEPQPLIPRIRKVLSHTKDSYPYAIRKKKSDEELVKEMKPLLEEILQYMEDGVIIKSKEYKDLML